MDKKKTKKIVSWVLALFIAVMFVQSLRFKFTGADETVHIFGTIGAWMETTIFSFIGETFASVGAYGVGIAELIAAILLIIPMTRGFGAVLSFFIMTGAIFFHLFTPLGIVVLGDGGSLFMFAVAIWIFSIVLTLMHKDQLQKVVYKN